jgi:hypothetical protein
MDYHQNPAIQKSAQKYFNQLNDKFVLALDMDFQQVCLNHTHTYISRKNSFLILEVVVKLDPHIICIKCVSMLEVGSHICIK